MNLQAIEAELIENERTRVEQDKVSKGIVLYSDGLDDTTDIQPRQEETEKQFHQKQA